MLKIFTLALMMPVAALAGERATIVVCPANLTYCYHEDRPVLPHKTVDDVLRESEQWRLEQDRQLKADFDRGMNGLNAELDRAYYLRGR